MSGYLIVYPVFWPIMSTRYHTQGKDRWWRPIVDSNGKFLRRRRRSKTIVN